MVTVLSAISEDDANAFQMIKVGLAIDITHLQIIGS